MNFLANMFQMANTCGCGICPTGGWLCKITGCPLCKWLMIAAIAAVVIFVIMFLMKKCKK